MGNLESAGYARMILIGYYWNFVDICKGWKLIHSKFITRLFTSIQKCVVLCMLSSYPSCNIHLILKFYVCLKYIRSVPSAVLQKDENLDGLVISQGAGGVLEPCLPWGQANIQEGGLVVSGDWYPSGRYVWTSENSKISLWTFNYMLRFELFNIILTMSFSFLSGFSFTDTDDSQDSRGRERTIFFPHSTTSTCSRTFRHLFATLHVRWLSHIFNSTGCIYQTVSRWDYHLIELPCVWLMMWY